MWADFRSEISVFRSEASVLVESADAELAEVVEDDELVEVLDAVLSLAPRSESSVFKSLWFLEKLEAVDEDVPPELLEDKESDSGGGGIDPEVWADLRSVTKFSRSVARVLLEFVEDDEVEPLVEVEEELSSDFRSAAMVFRSDLIFSNGESDEVDELVLLDASLAVPSARCDSAARRLADNWAELLASIDDELLPVEFVDVVSAGLFEAAFCCCNSCRRILCWPVLDETERLMEWLPGGHSTTPSQRLTRC